MKKTYFIAVLIISFMVISCIPIISIGADSSQEVHKIELGFTKASNGYKNNAKIDGKTVKEYNYTWHADPDSVHSEVKNCPAEYFTGQKPDEDQAVYIAHDVQYFPELDENGFKRIKYDGAFEWAYYYTAEEFSKYIFATLPDYEKSFPASMMHSEKEAYQNAVLHITEPGTYEIEGEWHGQIFVDLGDQDDTYSNEQSKVNVILNGVDITCSVAPAVVFYSAYECDYDWENKTSWPYNVDTSNAGVNVIIADRSVNNITGENVYRMLKTKYKEDDKQSKSGEKLQKKVRKIDGAFYSYVSMNICGEDADDGILNITAGFEGLDTEHHLTINGGNINIFSQDDGINVNEEDVSVFTLNDGTLHIAAGLGKEGDGIDSNGYILINDGTIIAIGDPELDSGIDSDNGTYLSGGTLVSLGSTHNPVQSITKNDGNNQTVMNLSFSRLQNKNKPIIITDSNNNVAFAFDLDRDNLAKEETKGYYGATISSPEIRKNSKFHIYSDGEVDGIQTLGIYDVSKINSFSASDLQIYESVWDSIKNKNIINNSVVFEMRDNTNHFKGVRNYNPNNDSSIFTDVFTTDWYNVDVNNICMKGLMKGTDFDKFSPYDYLSRGMLVTILYRMSNKEISEEEANVNFSDVELDAYYSKAIAWASSNAIVFGYQDNTFHPKDKITREQLSTILYRYFSIIDQGSLVTAKDSLENYLDNYLISDYAKDGMRWANANKIIIGNENDMLLPKENTTRAEAAAILMRYIKMNNN